MMASSTGTALMFKASLLSHPEYLDASCDFDFDFDMDAQVPAHLDREAGLQVGLDSAPVPAGGRGSHSHDLDLPMPMFLHHISFPRSASPSPSPGASPTAFGSYRGTSTCTTPTTTTNNHSRPSFKLDSYLDFLIDHSSDIRQFRMSSTETPNPMASLPDPPAVSCQTVAVTGILVDVYGLDELPPDPTHVSVVWLHNPRLGDRSRMAPMAKRMVGEHTKTRPQGTKRGLIAAAFDQRNHGSREVHHLANLAWNKGNTTHAQDMFGIVSGTVVDTRLLIDALPGYLFLDRPRAGRPSFDQHIACGVSLGGHSTWQTLFADPRVTAGVSIIGCPDFQLLMRDRARLSKRATYEDRGGPDEGATFLGSSDFPPALVAQCAQFDPKGIVFGVGDVVEDPAPAQQAPLREILDRHVRGKRFLLCTGGDDKLVPWRCSEGFTRFFVGAAEGWYRDAGLRVDNKIYAGKGHECSDEMVLDAVRFICDVVNGAEEGAARAVGSRI